MTSSASADVEFVLVASSVRAPVPASPSADGGVFARASQHCEPFRLASALGWYTFVPLPFELMLSDDEVLWRAGGREWAPVGRGVPLRDAQAAFRSAAHLADLPGAPPVLATGPEPGIVQVWTGIVARSSPDWMLLVRGVANARRNRGYQVLDGIIETDWWRGPLLSNLRLVLTDQPIAFSPNEPFAQVVPVSRSALDVQASVTRGLEHLSDEDLAEIRSSLEIRTPGRPGGYRREAVHRRRP
ncbi:MAG TPA: DUF6065 family protein [Acidimicrobiales bacterium]